MGITSKVAAALVALAIPAAAQASVIVAGKCESVSAPAGCLFIGNINGNTNPFNANSYLNAQLNYNIYNNAVPSAQPNITLNYLFDTDTTAGLITGAGSASGTWATPGYVIEYLAVKAGSYFVLYDIADASSGSWNTNDIPYGRNPKALSHIVFFGYESAAAVPEPAAWGMLIGGLGLAGGALRRRRIKPTAAAA